MGKGKLAAQVAHAAVSNILKILLDSSKIQWREWLEDWVSQGQPKIVVKAKDLGELLELYEKAKSSELPVSLIEDAGRTQLEPGTVTCIGIGPAPDQLMDQVTGDLKLL